MNPTITNGGSEPSISANQFSDVTDVSYTSTSKQSKTVQNLTKRIRELENNQKLAETRLHEILSSPSWKITEPLRALRRVFSSIIDRSKRTSATPLSQASGGRPNFDPIFYQRAYPDIGGMDPAIHYEQYGKNEGRLPSPEEITTLIDSITFHNNKETVLVVSHDAGRSGAPILSLNIIQQLQQKYHVISLLLNGGELERSFQERCDSSIQLFSGHSSYLLSIVLSKVIQKVKIKFAIANSIESRHALQGLATSFIPSICLIHEFAVYLRAKNAISEAVLWANEVVFSAPLVYKSAAQHCTALQKRAPVILPQGQCTIPQTNNGTVKSVREGSLNIRTLFRPVNIPDETVVILGIGSVELRKGVDIFLSSAARVLSICPTTPFRFVWVGAGFDPDRDTNYSAYLQDQIDRSGLGNHVCFTGELSDIESAYEFSDILLLSSRLDPLPNVAIDAMLHELPVICFDQTTGIADLLSENEQLASCVVPYLNIELAAQQLVKLIDKPIQRKGLGKSVKEFAQKRFNMKDYVSALEQLALVGVDTLKEEKNDCSVIDRMKAVDLNYYISPAVPPVSYTEAVRIFVRSWKSDTELRKPFAGFHPGIYDSVHGVIPSGRNALADFIDNGRPNGPWLSKLIQPSPSDIVDSSFRIALHIHAFYPEIFADIYQRLEGQNLQLDLLISAPSDDVAEYIRQVLRGYESGAIDIRVVPNRGRDIGPLLTEFNQTILDNYDIIGHVHTKKSADVKDAAIVQTWNRFLLENLIGKKYPMATTILNHLCRDEQLGLVFPDDPYVVGWTQNKKSADQLAKELELSSLPEDYFNFPVGNMFWARTEALRPLLIKGFTWDQYPAEPVPYDGTLLHALERIMPFVAAKCGFNTKTTHISDIRR